MKRGGGFLERRTPLERKSRLGKGKKGFRKYADQPKFKQLVFDLYGNKCWLCDAAPDDAHHLIPKRTLAMYGLAQSGSAADPRNGIPVCRKHHDAVERRIHLPMHYEDLPQCAIDFATELGLEWKLERTYPRRAA